MALQKIYLSSTRAADTFVHKTNVKRTGYLARWDGWNLETFIPDPRGYYDVRGVYDREVGTWGFKHTFPISSKGSWTVLVPRAGK